MTIKAVIFDMDGLLLDTERVYFEGYRRARTALGRSANDAGFMAMIGLPMPAGQRLIQQEFGADADRFASRWDHEIKQLMTADIPAKPGVRAVITGLQQRRIPYAIATSTYTAKAHDHLARADLGDLFDTIIGGDQISNGKPAPDIYLRAADTLGMDPAHCAAFEDSENGVRAAVAAGMTTVQIPDIKPPSPALLQLGHHVAGTLLAGIALLNLTGD